MDLGLGGKRCIVTGASRGIGAATAEILAAEGASVALLARSADALGERARALEKAHGVRAVPVPVDLARAAELSAAVARAIESLGGVDVLVNNAGASPFGSLEQIDDATWQESIDLKLLGYVRAIRAVLPHMRAQRSGRIVNVLGSAGVSASEGYVLGSLNTALAHITRSSALLAARDGIAVVAVHPGPTATERLLGGMAAGARAAGLATEAFVEKFGRENVPLGRIARPEEVARMIAVLASDTASFVTGAALQVDGSVTRGVS
jgi:NAD(P)-dependent dehydrogenase (short-subunit alcohol dehydrogenase family)